MNAVWRLVRTFWPKKKCHHIRTFSKVLKLMALSESSCATACPLNLKKGKKTKTRLQHLNSTRTARPFGGPGSSSRIQMLRFGAVFDRKRRRDDRKRRRNDRKRRRFRSFRRDPRVPDLNYRQGNGFSIFFIFFHFFLFFLKKNKNKWSLPCIKKKR